MIDRSILDTPTHVRFDDLLALCIRYFGSPRVAGSHHIFKTPWLGDPRINLQQDGGFAKPYRVRQVRKAINRWESEHED